MAARQVHRILFVASIGATLQYFVQPLAAALERDGFETIAAAGDIDNLTNFSRSYALPFFRRRGAREVASAFQRLSDIVRVEQPDLVHLHTPPALVIGRLAAKRHRVPSVAVAHGSFLEPRGWRSLVFASVEGVLGHSSVSTVTVNEEDAKFYRRVAGRRSVSVAPVGGIGLEVDRLTAAIRSPDRVAESPSIVVVGRLTPDKNLDLVVSAFAKFRLRHPKATLTFVGTAMPGELAWHVPQMPGIGSRPWVSDPYPMIAGADLLVSASRREGFALGVAEALALGVPAAAVSNRGVRQLLRSGATALTSCPPTAPALAHAMGRAIGRGALEDERARLTSMWSRENAISFHRAVVRRALGVDFP